MGLLVPKVNEIRSAKPRVTDVKILSTSPALYGAVLKTSMRPSIGGGVGVVEEAVGVVEVGVVTGGVTGVEVGVVTTGGVTAAARACKSASIVVIVFCSFVGLKSLL